MKQVFKKSIQAVLIAACAICQGCNWLGENGKGQGGGCTISLKFNPDELGQTKAAAIPDTNNFILTVTGPSGETIYSGKYGASPARIKGSAGTYHIRAVSEEFKTPSFDKIQWGDDVYIKAEEGEYLCAALVCRQVNSGIKMKVASTFLTSYPDGVLYLKSTEGKLIYNYRETRTAFFLPGSISLYMNRGSSDELLLKRTLGAGEILCLNINCAQQKEDAGGRISIAIDTTRTFLQEDFTIGGGNSGTSTGSKGEKWETAYNVSEIRDAIGLTDVWVAGYIVGGDLTIKSMNTEPPFSSASNLAIGPRSSTTSKDDCVAVQLSAGTDARESLNLVANPDRLGQHVYLCGDVVASYFGTIGLKNVSDFILK